MNRRFSILIGILLILAGGLVLAFNLLAPVLWPMLGWHLWYWEGWRWWPLVIVGGGLLLALSPLLVQGKRGLGALFILGLPILAIGGSLLFTSIFDVWDAWEWLWPTVILGFSAGFLLAAIYMQAVWLILPAIVIGANGLLFQFCALTDWWEVWAVLWTIEPLSLGIAFLVISAVKRSVGLFIAGLILCGFAGVGLIGMTAVMPGWWIVNLAGPVVLILVGGLLLLWSAIRRPSARVAEAE